MLSPIWLLVLPPIELFIPFEANQPHVVDVKLDNPSDQDCRIESVTTSCGCTVPEFSDNLIPARDTCSVQIRVSSGVSSRRSVVTFKFDHSPEVRLPVQIEGQPLSPPFVRVWPNDGIRIDDSLFATTSDFTFRCKCLEIVGETPWITNATAEHTAVSIEAPTLISENTLNETGMYREYEFAGVVKWPDTKTTEIASLVRLNVSTAPAVDLPVIRIVAKRTTAVIAIPESLFMRRETAERPGSRKIILRSKDEQDWRITSIGSNVDWISLSLGPEPRGDTKILVVSVEDAFLDDDPKSGEIIIQLDHPDCSVLKVPVHIK